MSERLLGISSHQRTLNFNTYLSHHGYDCSRLNREFHEYHVGKMILDGVSAILLTTGHGFVVQTSIVVAIHNTLIFPRQISFGKKHFYYFFVVGGTSQITIKMPDSILCFWILRMPMAFFY